MNESKYNIKSFTPEYELRKRDTLESIVGFTIIWLVINLFVFLISYFDNTVPYPDPIYWVLIISTPTIIILFVISVWMIKLYYYSISFEIIDDEIHVNRGIITKSRKIVPYRTITNIDIRQGPFDRIFKIGTIEIQTAGYSAGKTGPEEKIDGIAADQLDKLQKIIVENVRKIRGTPGLSHDKDEETDDIFGSILIEIKSLKELLISKLK
ncbi:MAG: PH domain-containing protein [Candidatus Heimdallarchaeota archaeon]|nr:PH domain-containing protein [Candidatus Heimdallarchaeota archaeon]